MKISHEKTSKPEKWKKKKNTKTTKYTFLVKNLM